MREQWIDKWDYKNGNGKHGRDRYDDWDKGEGRALLYYLILGPLWQLLEGKREGLIPVLQEEVKVLLKLGSRCHFGWVFESIVNVGDSDILQVCLIELGQL